MWRRAATTGNGGKIYCLVDADKLDYDVSEKAEQKHDHLLRGSLLANEILAFYFNDILLCLVTICVYVRLCFIVITALSCYHYIWADYRLVIVCNKENEDRAHMVTVFDKYRVSHPFIENASRVREYLQEHFLIHVHGNENSAAVADAQG